MTDNVVVLPTPKRTPEQSLAFTHLTRIDSLALAWVYYRLVVPDPVKAQRLQARMLSSPASVAFVPTTDEEAQWVQACDWAMFTNTLLSKKPW